MTTSSTSSRRSGLEPPATSSNRRPTAIWSKRAGRRCAVSRSYTRRRSSALVREYLEQARRGEAAPERSADTAGAPGGQADRRGDTSDEIAADTGDQPQDRGPPPLEHPRQARDAKRRGTDPLRDPAWPDRAMSRSPVCTSGADGHLHRGTDGYLHLCGRVRRGSWLAVPRSRSHWIGLLSHRKSERWINNHPGSKRPVLTRSPSDRLDRGAMLLRIDVDAASDAESGGGRGLITDLRMLGLRPKLLTDDAGWIARRAVKTRFWKQEPPRSGA